MENNEVLDTGMSVDGFGVNDQVRANLAETKRWTKFIAIIGFIMTGLVLIGGIGAVIAMGSMGGGAGIASGAAMLIVAVLYFFPFYYLWKYASNMDLALRSSNQQMFTDAWKYMKSYFKFFGVLMCIVLALYAVIFIVGLLGAAF